MWKPSSQSETITDFKQPDFVEKIDPVKQLSDQVVRKITDFRGTPEETLVHNEMLAACAIGDQKAQQYVKAMIKDILNQLGVAFETVDKYTKQIYESNYGLGPIEDLFNDHSINEIWVNGAEHIWIERNGKKHRIDRHFVDDADVIRVIRLMLQYDHQEVTRVRPVAESRMADGSRITVIIPEVAKRPYINIRKFQAFQVTEDNLLQAGTVTPEMVEFLKLAIKGRSNILLIGETGSGKTSFLQYLVSLIDPSLRLGTIETKFELKIDEKFPERNVFCYEMHDEFDIDMAALFKVVLRSSPDIVIVGEARGEEANDLINAMRRGHPGSMSTIHTNSPETAVDDLADMINQDGKRRDPLQLRHRIASAIDIIIQIHRFEDTGVRRVVRISEVIADANSLNHEIRDIFYFDVPDDGSQGSFKRGLKLTDELKKKWSYYSVTQQDIMSIGL